MTLLAVLPMLLSTVQPFSLQQPTLSAEHEAQVERLKAAGADVRVELAEDRKTTEIWIDYNGAITTQKVELISGLTPLTALRFLQSDLNDKMLGKLKNLPNLWLLVIISPKITDEGLTHVANMSGLKKLDLNRMTLSARGLRKLEKLKKLKRLYLYNAKVTDTDLLALKGLTWLELLDLPPSAGDRLLDELRRSLPNTKVERGP